MAATVEVNYFNSFWLKKVVKDGDTDPTWPGLPWNPYGYFEITTGLPVGAGYVDGTDLATTTSGIGLGMTVNITAAGGITAITISNAGFNYVNTDTITVVQGVATGGTVALSTIPFPFNSGTPKTGSQNFYIEEARVKGGFNNTIVDLGVRAYAVNENRDKLDRTHSLIFSGIYNTRTGFNETNVFSVAQAIIKDADPINGSIQKLYTEDTNLMVFQENKVSKTLINKSTIYSGEQGAEEALGVPKVLGQLVPYLGEYGISSNPESFAIYGYRKYFADKNRSAILRLSRDGITEISAYGMRDYFRDYLATIDDSYNRVVISKALEGGLAGTLTEFNVESDCCNMEIGSELELETATSTTTTNSIVTDVEDVGGVPNECKITIDIGVNFSAATYINANFVTYRRDKVLGAWDMHDQNYIVSMQTEPRNASTDSSTFNTVAFDESINGWTSFYSYKPVFIDSLKNKFYSFVDSNIYEHHYDNPPVYDTRCKFYGATTPEEASITLIFNPSPSITKNFNTVAYEGANGWEVDYFRSDYEGIDPNIPYTTPFSYTGSNQYRDTTNTVRSYDEGKYAVNGITSYAGFNRKENKYVANLVSDSVARPGEIIFGNQVSGIKGYLATVKLSTDSTTDPGGAKELFSVSSNYVLSSS